MRCLMLTSGSAAQVAARLEALAGPHVVVPANAVVMPRGFRNQLEAWLGVSMQFLTTDQRSELAAWWVGLKGILRPPSWDIVSTCTIEGHQGLVLVEAKAHAAELKPFDSCAATSTENRDRIGQAIAEAGGGLSTLLPGWHLRADSHYQLCNRFAWAWKLAAMGVPVVLVYLGFLNADEMADVGPSFVGPPFTSPRHWDECVRAYAEGVVPAEVWERRLDVGGTPLRAVIRALDFRWGTFAV
jgi:hypothetical protein